MRHVMYGFWMPALLAGAQALTWAAGDPIDVGDHKQLFIDGLFFESSDGMALHVCPAAKTNEHTLVSDRPWENATLNWFSVMNDLGRYRMWYECYDVDGWPTSNDTSFCYADSKDGIHWDKPSLGYFAYHGKAKNNILFRQIGPAGAKSRVHGAGVFIDPSAPPEARYKAVSQGAFDGFDPPQRIAGMYSSNGLNWIRQPKPICDLFADSQYSGFWDAGAGQYVLYGRVGGHGASIGRSASATFDHFDPLTLVFQTDDQDPPDSNLYNPAAVKYPDADRVYLMFPSLYQRQPDTLDIHLAVSRDGIHWSWPERGKPFIPLGGAGAFDSGSLYMGQGLIVVGGEVWQYYSGSPLKHNEVELEQLAKPENRRIYSRTISRLDGFVSADAGEIEGGFTTPPLIFSGESLQLNVKTGAAGEVRVGLTDGAGAPVAGFALDDCIPITGDHLEATVAWKGKPDLGGLAGKPVKLVVRMRDASLFAFRFVQTAKH